MNNAYESLRSTLYGIAEKNTNEKTPFLSSYKEDLEDYDRDVILNDAQKGDHFLSTLKASGCGTYLQRITKDNDSIPFRVKSTGKDSVYHILSFTGINQATIKKVSYDDAIDCINNRKYWEPSNRVPRRIPFRQYICQMIGRNENAISGTLFSSIYCPDSGDKTLLKISFSETLKAVMLEICRSDSKDERKIGKVESFYIDCPQNKEKLMTMINGKTNHFLLTHSDSIYADIKPITERVYVNAVKRAGLEKTNNDEGMTL